MTLGKFSPIFFGTHNQPFDWAGLKSSNTKGKVLVIKSGI
jgi:hypothetical protein